MVKSRTNQQIGYILRSYPRLSQTFILNEILALETIGVSIQIFALSQPEECSLSGNQLINQVQLDLAHSGRYQRCVLKYRLGGEQVDTHQPLHEIVYGKVDADGQGGLTVQVISALPEKLREPNLPYYYRVPVSYGYLPDLKLLLMEALPGGPVIKDLIKEGGEDGAAWKDGSLSVEDAMGICAQMLVSLHTSAIQLGRRNSMDIKAASMREEIRLMQAVFPELGNQLNVWLDEVLAYAQIFRPCRCA